MFKILLFLSIIQRLQIFSNACECLEPPAFVNFCKSDIVARVEFVNRTPAVSSGPGGPGDDNMAGIVYVVKYKKIYRASGSFNESKSNNIVDTPSPFGICGLDVNIDKKDSSNNEWFLYGNIGASGHVTTSICNFNKHWSNDTKNEVEKGALSKIRCAKNIDYYRCERGMDRPNRHSDEYCRSDVVARVTLSNRTVVNTTNDDEPVVKYGVEFTKIYRSSKRFDKYGNKREIYVSSTGCKCSLDPFLTSSAKNDWFIYGVIANGTGIAGLTTDLCHSNEPWNDEIKEKVETGALSKLKCS